MLEKQEDKPRIEEVAADMTSKQLLSPPEGFLKKLDILTHLDHVSHEEPEMFSDDDCGVLADAFDAWMSIEEAIAREGGKFVTQADFERGYYLLSSEEKQLVHASCYPILSPVIQRIYQAHLEEEQITETEYIEYRKFFLKIKGWTDYIDYEAEEDMLFDGAEYHFIQYGWRPKDFKSMSEKEKHYAQIKNLRSLNTALRKEVMCLKEDGREAYNIIRDKRLCRKKTNPEKQIIETEEKIQESVRISEEELAELEAGFGITVPLAYLVENFGIEGMREDFPDLDFQEYDLKILSSLFNFSLELYCVKEDGAELTAEQSQKASEHLQNTRYILGRKDFTDLIHYS